MISIRARCPVFLYMVGGTRIEANTFLLYGSMTIDLPCSNHRIEVITVFEGGTRDAFICVDVSEIPVGMISDQLAVVCLLELIR